MKINWNFLGGGGVQNKKPYVGGVWIFSGTEHYIICKLPCENPLIFEVQFKTQFVNPQKRDAIHLVLKLTEHFTHK